MPASSSDQAAKRRAKLKLRLQKAHSRKKNNAKNQWVSQFVKDPTRLVDPKRVHKATENEKRLVALTVRKHPDCKPVLESLQLWRDSADSLGLVSGDLKKAFMKRNFANVPRQLSEMALSRKCTELFEKAGPGGKRITGVDYFLES